MKRAFLWLTASAALTWAIVRVAPQTLPHIESGFELAYKWPNADLPDTYAFMRHSPLGPWVVQLVGVPNPTSYVLLHVVVIALALAGMSAWVVTAIPKSGNRFTAFRFLALGPIVAVLVTGIGSYDPWSLLALSLVLWAWRSRNKWAITASGIPLGLQHFEQGLVALVALAVVYRFADLPLPRSLKDLPSILWSLIGMAIGKLVLLIALQLNGVDPFAGRSLYLLDAELLKTALTSSANYFPILFYSLFAGLWALVVFTVTRRQSLRQQGVLIAVIGSLFLFSAVTLDHTRVFSLIALPLVALLIVAVSSSTSRRDQQMLRVVEGVAWLAVPILVLTNPDGETYLTPLNALDHWIMFIQGWLI